MEEAGESESELYGSTEVSERTLDAQIGGRTCSELPVWNAHQTNMAEKDTAELSDDRSVSEPIERNTEC